jgi:hypothetical protein
MPILRKQFDTVCFGLYLTVAVAGISMEAIVRAFAH